MPFATNPTTIAAIRAAAQTHDSFYLYGEAEICHVAAQLQAAFPAVGFLYSLKNNPHPPVANCLFGAGFGADAASLAEVMQSVAAGVPKERIQYSAPGKTVADITAALPHATLIADSLGEIQRIHAIAANQDITANIGVRIHPSVSFEGGAAAPSKFGIEETQAIAAVPTWRAMPHINVVGLHIHCCSQSLHTQHLQQYHANVLACANRFAAALGTPLAFVNMGSGIGIPYAPCDTPLCLAEISAETNANLAVFHAAHPSTHVYIETGRYCVGNNGIYVSKVLDIKTCGGKTYAILANTLNGFVRPSLAHLFEANGAAPAAEPLYTTKDAFQTFVVPCGEGVAPIMPITQITSMGAISATDGMERSTHTATPAQRDADGDTNRPAQTFTLVGNLCTATDLLADITLPALQVGDCVVTTNAGSYAAVLSPMQFSQQVPPAQLMVDKSVAHLLEDV